MQAQLVRKVIRACFWEADQLALAFSCIEAQRGYLSLCLIRQSPFLLAVLALYVEYRATRYTMIHKNLFYSLLYAAS